MSRVVAALLCTAAACSSVQTVRVQPDNVYVGPHLRPIAVVHAQVTSAYFMFIAGGYFLGNMQVSRHAHAANGDRTTSLGLWLQLIAAVLALIFVAAGLRHPLWMFGPMLPLAFGQGLAMPHLTARAVEMAPGNAGVAASLLGFSQQALAAISLQLMGWARTDTAVPLMLFCTAAALVAIVPIVTGTGRKSDP